MKHKLEALGLALVATFALTAALASGAHAGTFTSTSTHTLLEGKGAKGAKYAFTAAPGAPVITCTGLFSGTMIGKATEEWDLGAAIGTCSDNLGREVIRDSSALRFILTSNGMGGGTMHITGSWSFTTKVAGVTVCTMTITTPQEVNGITYVNGLVEVEVKTGTTNLANNTNGAGCNVANGNHANGTISGVTSITGKDKETKEEAFLEVD